MNYLETIAYIDSLAPTLGNPSLKRISNFLSAYGNPQNSFPSILVGGTNGKGSTVAVLDSVLRQAGLKVGRFTGPHLLKWNERFHINGLAISDGKFASLATDIREKSESFGQIHPDLGHLTWFEFLTAIAFSFFAQEQVDIAVVEVGLGGRFDATNVLDNVLASAITNVDLDHTHILGNSIQKIAFEKAGIIKPRVPIITACNDEALDIISSQAREQSSDLIHYIAPNTVALLQSEFISDSDWGEATYKLYSLLGNWTKHLSLLGKYQTNNAQVAILILLAMSISIRKTNHWQLLSNKLEVNKNLASFMLHGISNVYWPGRMQFVSDMNIIMDGAHNPAGTLALRNALDDIFPNEKKCFIISCFKNKDVAAMLSTLIRPEDSVFISEAIAQRAVFSKHLLADIITQLGAKPTIFLDLKTAFTAAMNRNSHELIIATGSFATVREMMHFLGWNDVEQGHRLRSDICLTE